MGCDIHLFVEYKAPTNNFWTPWGGEFSRRFYETFGFLAGVRGDGPVIVPPRGIPEDLSYMANGEYWLYIDKNATTSFANDNRYICPEDAARWERQGCKIKDGNWVENPDAHTPSWLTFEEFKAAIANAPSAYYNAIVKSMEELEFAGYTTRVVFWFDN